MSDGDALNVRLSERLARSAYRMKAQNEQPSLMDFVS